MHFSRRKFIGTALATGAVASTTAVPSLAAATTTTTTTTTTQPPATTPPTLAAPTFSIGTGDYVVFSVPPQPSGYTNHEDYGILGLGIFETSASPPSTCAPGSTPAGCSMDPCSGSGGYEICINGLSQVYGGASWNSSHNFAKNRLTQGTTYYARWLIRDGDTGDDQWSPATSITLP